ncbi:hypothetical protein [Amycolatopsis sp. NPDC057786]|uniref:hypothetical protein n=1 Tax=Amycolatopsis sp. NPDC057786 TaxID=3346250 RepID=UPI00366B4AFA
MTSDLTVLVAADDELILRDVPDDIVAAFRDFAFVGKENPRTAENALTLGIVHLGIVDDRGRNSPVFLYFVQTLLENLPEFVPQHVTALASDIIVSSESAGRRGAGPR